VMLCTGWGEEAGGLPWSDGGYAGGYVMGFKMLVWDIDKSCHM